MMNLLLLGLNRHVNLKITILIGRGGYVMILNMWSYRECILLIGMMPAKKSLLFRYMNPDS